MFYQEKMKIHIFTRKNRKVQICKRFEIVKSNNRIIQKSKRSNLQSRNIKKIFAVFEINICKKNLQMYWISVRLYEMGDNLVEKIIKRIPFPAI